MGDVCFQGSRSHTEPGVCESSSDSIDHGCSVVHDEESEDDFGSDTL
jgi:hypothetical protein